MRVVAIVDARKTTGTGNFLTPVHGVPLLTHAVRGLLDSGSVDLVLVAARARHVVSLEKVLDLPCRVIAGGPTTAGSVRAALDAAGHCDVVLVHEATRAFTPPALVREVVGAVRAGRRVVVPVLPMSDTVKIVDGDMVVGTRDRSVLRTAQTPVGYAVDVLREACASGEPEPLRGVKGDVHTVDGHPNALRVDTRLDLVLATALLAAGREEAL